MIVILITDSDPFDYVISPGLVLILILHRLNSESEDRKLFADKIAQIGEKVTMLVLSLCIHIDPPHPFLVTSNAIVSLVIHWYDIPSCC